MLIFITEEEVGERLDKVLAKRFEGHHSRTYFQYLISEGLVTLNGKSAKKRFKLVVDDEININFIATAASDVVPENIPLNILYEDESVLVVNKPAGMVVHPAPGNWTKTFVNGFLYHCQQEKTSDIRPGIVHRLDKDTSGVMIAAKTTAAQTHLIEQFAERKAKKEYYAICHGNPGTSTVNAPIGRHPIRRKMMTVIEGGRPAETRFETVGYDHKISFVKVYPKTGRTHQIRVHMKHIGHPIVGDVLYGKEDSGRQLLHAAQLTIVHPNGVEMTFEAPLPEDMRSICERLFKE